MYNIKKNIKNKYLIIIILIISLILLLYLFNIVERFDDYLLYNNDEKDCLYINSYGIIKSLKNIPNIYYIKADQLNRFTIPDKKFIIVTGNEDTTIPDDNLEKSNEILNSPNLIHWYSQNLTKTDSSKLSAIPIGLDYHTIGNGKKGYEWWGKQETPKQQEEIIFKLNNTKFNERIPKLYINFAKSIRGRYGEKDRMESLDQIPKDLQIIEKDHIPRNETWTNMSKYTFVLSPHGNGLDCHRTWEALVLGCIPVVKTSSLDVLYEDLPVLIVNNWSDINQDLLNSTIEEFINKNFNYDKLKLDYWIKQINNINK
jgi:hypothetical protein